MANNEIYIAPETIKYMLSLDGKNIEEMNNDELISYLSLTTSFIEEQIKAIIEYSEHRDEIYNGTYKNTWNVFMDRIVRKTEWSDYSDFVKKYEPFYPEHKSDNNVQTLKDELENIRLMIDEIVKRAGLENEWKDVLKEEFKWLAFMIEAVKKISGNNEIVPFVPFMHTVQTSEYIKANIVANGNKKLKSDISEALKRFFKKDFGSISEKEKNEVISAKYDTCVKPIYILNQLGGTLTTIVFCDEYERLYK